MIPTKTLTPFVPITVDEIVDDVLAAAKLGAAIVHDHGRGFQNFLNRGVVGDLAALSGSPVAVDNGMTAGMEGAFQKIAQGNTQPATGNRYSNP